ncbi:hypothetical protein BT96DRAFT_950091 [Gymnopus androsaceus JB14]|uniref:Uncharacterized protein n=1 Tax=Gymnopus androsaceus JB14 TaxID=1447944 RepID=A0A6A4GIB7_9AGAR|nr:hypothetical protein BT96DRAFT_950091 [Gymnopus androsaceus JB14]
MSVSGSSSDGDPGYVDVDLERFVKLCDASRSTLLTGRSPDTPLLQFQQKDIEAYINLVLCGVNDRDTYELGRMRNHERVFRHSACALYRDVDSALIFREDFPWSGPYDLVTTYADKKSLHGYLHAHVRFEFQDADEGQYRDPGTDPNVFWGVCGASGRHRIHLMLPDVANDANEIPIQDLYPLIYDAIYATAQTIIPENTSSWNPTYQAELDRTAQFTNRAVQTESRKCIPELIGQAFADEFMDKIREHSWGTHAYWFIQIRGAKDDTRHHGPIDDATINHILQNIIRHQSVIFLDMGLEIHLPEGYASMPARAVECHSELAEIAWNIDPGREWDYGLYQPDVWAGVADIAGFRCNYSKQPRTQNRISYIQVYTTDKFATYNASSQGSKAVLKMNGPDDVVTPLAKVYGVTAANQTAKTLTVTRLEARVPLMYAKTVNRAELQVSDFRGVIHAVPVKTIWAWRIHRILACYFIIRYAAGVKRDSRADINYLTLLGTVIYLFNSIHSRPGEMQWDRTLTQVVFPSTTLDNNPQARDIGMHSPDGDSDKFPIMERGAIWLRPITYPRSGEGDVLRFTFLKDSVSEKTISRVLNMKWHAIQDLFKPSYTRNPFQSGHLRHKLVGPSDKPMDRPIALPAGHRDVTFQTEVEYYDNAPDLPAAAMVGLPAETQEQTGSLFFVGLLSQVFQRTGTMGKTRFEYSMLNQSQMTRVNLATFDDMNISSYLKSFQYPKVTTAQTWAENKVILFPGVSDQTVALGDPSVQGWNNVPLFKVYLAKREAGGKEFEDLRKFCWRLYDTLSWVPRVATHRVFDNKARKSWIHIFPGQANTGTPILINPKNVRPVTCEAGRAPVLDRAQVDADDAAEQALRAQHQQAIPALMRAIWGGIPVPEEDEGDVDEVPQQVVRYVQERLPRRGGRQYVYVEVNNRMTAKDCIRCGVCLAEFTYLSDEEACAKVLRFRGVSSFIVTSLLASTQFVANNDVHGLHRGVFTSSCNSIKHETLAVGLHRHIRSLKRKYPEE